MIRIPWTRKKRVISWAPLQGSVTKFCRIPSRYGVWKHLFCPCDQQQCNKSQDLFLHAQERDLSRLYPRCKRHLTAMIHFRISRHPQDTLSESLRASTTQAHQNLIPQKEPSLSKSQTALAQALTLQCSSWSPILELLCCLVQWDYGTSFHLPCVTAAPRPLLYVWQCPAYPSAPTANTAFHRAEVP